MAPNNFQASALTRVVLLVCAFGCSTLPQAWGGNTCAKDSDCFSNNYCYPGAGNSYPAASNGTCQTYQCTSDQNCSGRPGNLTHCQVTSGATGMCVSGSGGYAVTAAMLGGACSSLNPCSAGQACGTDNTCHYGCWTGSPEPAGTYPDLTDANSVNHLRILHLVLGAPYSNIQTIELQSRKLPPGCGFDGNLTSAATALGLTPGSVNCSTSSGLSILADLQPASQNGTTDLDLYCPLPFGQTPGKYITELFAVSPTGAIAKITGNMGEYIVPSHPNPQVLYGGFTSGSASVMKTCSKKQYSPINLYATGEADPFLPTQVTVQETGSAFTGIPAPSGNYASQLMSIMNNPFNGGQLMPVATPYLPGGSQPGSGNVAAASNYTIAVTTKNEVGLKSTSPSFTLQVQPNPQPAGITGFSVSSSVQLTDPLYSWISVQGACSDSAPSVTFMASKNSSGASVDPANVISSGASPYQAGTGGGGCTETDVGNLNYRTWECTANAPATSWLGTNNGPQLTPGSSAYLNAQALFGSTNYSTPAIATQPFKVDTLGSLCVVARDAYFYENKSLGVTSRPANTQEPVTLYMSGAQTSQYSWSGLSHTGGWSTENIFCSPGSSCGFSSMIPGPGNIAPGTTVSSTINPLPTVTNTQSGQTYQGSGSLYSLDSKHQGFNVTVTSTIPQGADSTVTCSNGTTETIYELGTQDNFNTQVSFSPNGNLGLAGSPAVAPIPFNQSNINFGPPSKLKGIEIFGTYLYQPLGWYYSSCSNVEKFGQATAYLFFCNGDQSSGSCASSTAFGAGFVPSWVQTPSAGGIPLNGSGSGASSLKSTPFSADVTLAVKSGLSPMKNVTGNPLPPGPAWLYVQQSPSNGGGQVVFNYVGLRVTTCN